MKSPLALLTTLAVLAALLAAHCLAQPNATEVERMRQRYAPMFRQLSFTPEQGEHFIQLKLRQFEVNRQLQQEVREKNLAGDSPEVAARRRTLSAPINEEFKALLGPEGMRFYQRFEVISAYRLLYVAPLNWKLTAAQIPLTPGQEDQLTEIIANAVYKDRENRTDISTKIHVDWGKVVRDSADLLSPQQLTILEAHAEKMNR